MRSPAQQKVDLRCPRVPSGLWPPLLPVDSCHSQPAHTAQPNIEEGARVGVGTTEPGQGTGPGARPSGFLCGSTTDWLCDPGPQFTHL